MGYKKIENLEKLKKNIIPMCSAWAKKNRQRPDYVTHPLLIEHLYSCECAK